MLIIIFLNRYKQYLAPIHLFVFFILTAFVVSISTQVKAEYCNGEYCDTGDTGDIYWLNAPTYHVCKPHKKRHYVYKKKVAPIKRYYRKTVIVPVYTSCTSCPRARCCYDDCCGNYNPDLTTGDDDPSIYPDLNIDR